MRRFCLFIGLLVCCAVLTFAADELCTDGVLLYREDFGGNDPNDPTFYAGDAPGMSSNYHNCNGGKGSGCYAITKKGVENGMQWHRQDDHTYPNDTTRGYFLEVDGVGGDDYFYNTTIDNLCSDVELTFSAYVVNIAYAGQIPYLKENFNYVYPRMKFVLKDPTTGAVLASKSTGDIQPDSRYETSEAWKYARENELSAEWQLFGLNFNVPDGVTSIQMYIYNDAKDGMGNDFAVDDIEVRRCLPPVSKDTAICDTLLPFTWTVFGETLVFDEPGTKIFGAPLVGQTSCDDTTYVVKLNTYHCERFYPLIVNKYNWQLLCNNVELHQLFPNLQAKSFQWYRVQGEETEPIDGATEDNYAEQNELHGAYQLRVTMDDGRNVWSRVVQIDETQENQPLFVQIYNSSGVQVSEEQMKHGIFLLHYRQGNHVWTEKRLIP